MIHGTVTSQPTTADKRFLIMAASFNFIVLGVGQSLLGPSFRELEAAFSIPATTVSVSVSVLFLGATIGILCSGLALRRFGYRKVMVGWNSSLP